MVVSWIRWWGRKLYKPSRPKHIARLCREASVSSVREVSNCPQDLPWVSNGGRKSQSDHVLCLHCQCSSLELWMQGLNPMVDTSRKGWHQAEGRPLFVCVGLWISQCSSWVLIGEASYSPGCPGGKNLHLRRVRRGHGEGQPWESSSKVSVTSRGGSSALPILFTLHVGSCWLSLKAMLDSGRISSGKSSTVMTHLPLRNQRLGALRWTQPSPKSKLPRQLESSSVVRCLGVDDIRHEYLKSLDVVVMFWLTCLWSIA